jgi:hypothetical protein
MGALCCRPARVVGVTEGEIRVTAVSWTSFAQKVPLRWEPPMVDKMQNRDYAEFQWRRLQVSFPDLPDPASVLAIPGASLTPDELDAIDRYLDLAPELAEASLFAANEQFTVSIDDQDGSEAIETIRSARDVTVGFLVTWRQFYSGAEDASFDKVRGYLMREAKGTPAFEPIKAWSKAGGRLKGAHLEHLVLQGLAARGDIPKAAAAESTHDPARVDNPQILISKQLYGDLVHWGEERRDLALVVDDQFMVAWERLNALEAAVALGYIYIGFASVIAAAVGRSP